MQPPHQPHEHGGQPEGAPQYPQPGWHDPGDQASAQGYGHYPPPQAPAYPAPGQGYGYYPPPQTWLPTTLNDPRLWDPNNPEVGRAEPGLRFVARLIDTVVFVIVWFLMMMLATLGSVIIGEGEIEGDAMNVFVPLYLFNFFVLPILLEWLQVRLWGRSVGKIILGLWVVRSDGSGEVKAGRALVRALLYAPGHTNVVNWLLPWSLTNVLWQLRDKRFRRCLHDKIAGTVVVQVRR